MSSFFGFLLILSLIAFVVGMIKPKLVMRWAPEEKQKRKWVAIVSVVCIVLFSYLASATMTPEEKAAQQAKQEQQLKEKEAKKQAEAEKKAAEEKAKAEKEAAEKAAASESAKPAQVATLHVTPAVFMQRYNEYLHSQGGELGASGALDLAEPNIQSGSVNDTVAYANNDLNLALNETIDKNTGEIKEVFVTSAIAGKDGKTIQSSLMIALVSYNALIYAVDPNSNRDTVQKGLGLQENVGEWAKNTETNHNGIKYFKMVAKGIGLSFGASAQ